MKLKINKACDLSSISVLPPHKRSSSMMPPGPDASGLGRSQASQIRSQSQQSFSQGMSFSQLSQNSFDDNLLNDQRFGSQERDNSSKRITSLASIATTRDDSKLQLSRASNNALQHWKKAASAPENRCHSSEEIGNRIQQMESSLNRLGMILHSVQSDVMQVTREVKEITLETECIRKKIFVLDNSMHQMLKGEDNIKTLLERSMKSIPDQMIKESDCNKLNEIAIAVSVLPKQIEASLLKLQHEVCMVFTKEMETFKNKYPDRIQSPETRSYISTRQPPKNLVPKVELPVPPSKDHRRKVSESRMEAEFLKALEPKITDSKHNMIPKQEEIPLLQQEQDFRVIISDEESDGCVSCLLVKKETGRGSLLMEEAKEESVRILKKARKRKRRLNNFVVLD